LPAVVTDTHIRTRSTNPLDLHCNLPVISCAMIVALIRANSISSAMARRSRKRRFFANAR